jgi:hypothetical protein
MFQSVSIFRLLKKKLFFLITWSILLQVLEAFRHGDEALLKEYPGNMFSHIFIAHHQNMQIYFVSAKLVSILASLMCELY